MASELDRREWLETDGLGGFASGTVCGVRTRRYHALLLPAATLSAGRLALVNGFDAWVTTPAGKFPVSSQRYAPDAVFPEGAAYLAHFEANPWPQWVFALPDGTRIVQEIFVPHENPVVAVSWRAEAARGLVFLEVRPFFSGRDYHALHHENPDFRFELSHQGESFSWHPYAGVPGIAALSNGAYHHEPYWYRQFLYEQEQARGLDCVEDLASPGVFQWSLSDGEAILLFGAENKPVWPPAESAFSVFEKFRLAEKSRRKAFASRLDRAASDYLIRQGKRTGILAGYPWLAETARDTFISLRGLCLATGHLNEAREIIFQWAAAVSEGMLPERFTESAGEARFNSVDASLWYVVAIDAFMKACEWEKARISGKDQAMLRETIENILGAYAQGTRSNIRCDEDGLLACGVPGAALTWTSTRAGDGAEAWRIGKPVEVQTLWLNALWIGSAFSQRWEALFVRARESFRQHFWNEAAGALYDVVDAGHKPGAADASLRPNQIFAVGGLPIALLSGEKARRVLETVEANLLTPLGLREEASGQSTVWPWLMGAFVEAWIRVNGATPDTIREARERFLAPLLASLDQAGINHVSEMADAQPPHKLRSCPFHARSLAELLRLDRVVLAIDASAEKSAAARALSVKKRKVGALSPTNR